jgi:aminopeptidase
MTHPGPDPDAFAALLCDWCLEVRSADQVTIGAPPLAEPLLRALHRALLEREAWPLLRLEPEWASEDFYRSARPLHLDGFAPAALNEAECVQARVRIAAPANTRALAGTDPAAIARAARGRERLREAQLAARWCATLWPTSVLAQQAGMSDTDYAAFVRRALFLDRADPIAAWRNLRTAQERLVQRLTAGTEIRIEAQGTDVRLRVDGRTWINSDGRRNMPSGEVFTGPIETSANGTIRFTIPSSPRGVEVSGVSLTFADGEVIAATAERGEEYLRAAIETDSGARFLGELGIGTNAGIDRPTGSILLDEKMAGTVHLALGRSYPETGGRNSSALHWDLICDLRAGGRMTVDNEVVSEAGTLVQ